VLIDSTAELLYEFRTNDGGFPGAARTLYTGGQNLGQPTVNHVRSGHTFGVSNEYTGTLAIPDPSYVSTGVATDDTVGTLEHLTLSDLQSALQPNAPTTVERSADDTKSITFSWPVSGATITGQKSIDSAAYSPVSGAISYLRQEGTKHYYSLAYNVNDRPSEEGTVRYAMTDGTYTKYFSLRVENVVDTSNLATSSDITSLQNNSPMEAY
jgi:hypothetical protein